MDMTMEAPSFLEIKVDRPSSDYDCLVLASKLIKIRPEGRASQKNDNQKDGAFTGMRWDSMRSESLSVGAQHGFEKRSKEINDNLQLPEIKIRLNRIYNFQVIQTDANIVPPVITEANESMNVDSDGQSARMAKKTWEIIVPARISTVPPHWASYLFLKTSSPKEIVYALMPSNNDEETFWKSTFCTGFEHGIAQANASFENELNRLTRDYMGMLRFRQLADAKIVTMPSIEEGRLGVTMNGQQMFVDDRTLVIEAPATWNAQKKPREIMKYE